ncbi:MAG: aldolase [Deferribacteres bacterium]|nr:aldolase [candidate division KSB1 bacterium]MCB9501071.1 aldolase [Deferribacteres bacterium]
MTGQQFKIKLKNGDRVYGSAVVCPSPHWPGAVQQANLDFVFLDLEHTAWEREKISLMCRLYAALGMVPIVRTPSPDPYEASMTLAGGAVGILAPYIETVEQVQSLVGAVKHHPVKGRKLQQLLADKNEFEPVLKQYTEKGNQNNILLINVESVPALENLEQLITVPGLDGVIIGPHDLSCSMGIPEDYQNPEFKKAVKSIITTCRDNGTAVGIHFSETPQVQIEWVQAGVNIILHSSDISLYGKALQKDLVEIRAACGDDTSNGDGEKMII